jgi:ribosomal protein S18 acetylase RimI-like enzyme
MLLFLQVFAILAVVIILKIKHKANTIMNIRAYQDKDYNEIKVILQSGGHFDEVWDSRNHWKAKIEKDPASIFVSENEGEILGCILIINDPWNCFLFRFAVKEEYRGKGIGSSLMSLAEEQLAKNGAEEVTIFVNEKDSDLQDYYKKRGYIAGGEYRCLYKKLQK